MSNGFDKKFDARVQRLILTLIAKKYFFCVVMLCIWWGKVAPEGWFEILGFVAAVIGIDVYQKKVGINGNAQPQGD